MRKIAIINQKGGVGKTTTVVNLASGLADMGKKVLVLDLDAQGNLGTCFNKKSERDMYNLIVDKDITYKDCIAEVNPNLHIITSKETLEKAEIVMTGFVGREMTLVRKLKELRQSDYDYVLLDCPPSLGLLNQNALLFSSEAVIPVSTDFLGIDALQKMFKAIDTINDVFEHNLKVTAVVPTLYDARNKICKESLDYINKKYKDMVTSPVRVSSKLKESPMSGKSIFAYAKYNRAAKDYLDVVNKIDFLGYSSS
jgi:chromosome partitioning protein